MRCFLASLVLMSVVVVQGAVMQADWPRTTGQPVPETNFAGRWRVKFTLSGTGEKNLVFDSQANGSGSFLLLDTAPDGKSVVGPLPAAWSQTTNDRVNFSGEV